MPKIVTTDFFANGKCVWRKEYPTTLTTEQIEKEVSYIAEIGYGTVEAVTDSTGRYIRIKASQETE
ncbi:hypothetical protein [Paenibacillus oleatilyticus]|uniref:hypothetical protein n=1 Tax=Paenibacillus oleatilyticus TaxID=2594886 RepID=UPI001C1F2B5B|nr:hypothetical protein [Paenibacillus oleatilyticus]MBU7319004.1 hypothetical protein [Paenibacillus oleatilyticus]